VMRLPNRDSSVRFGDTKPKGRGPNREFMEMSKRVRLCGSGGINCWNLDRAFPPT
jgi:hypothetical protein